MCQQTLDPALELRIRESFALQTAMKTIGATLESIRPGEIQLRMPFNPEFSQQHGYLHAGIVTTLVDSACGYAGLTLLPMGSNILTVEFKANFMLPAVGETFLATGRVIKSGKTLTVCQGEVVALRNGAEPATIAIMQATMMALRP